MKKYYTLECDTKKDDGGIMRVMASSVYNTDTIEYNRVGLTQIKPYLVSSRIHCSSGIEAQQTSLHV